MIDLTAMNNRAFILNADHIEKIEEVPETLITLTNGKKYIVLERVEEVVEKVIKYKNKIVTYRL
ncbi:MULTISPECIES: flagellar FlbD family protein [unclassified Clostridium]|uniref:flagellar FlbD family protein n=1 Tax=unclassified Clostridium TaxID=2614128 RepID=UPI0025BF3EF7|nr:flagellar FlbD family protein [Clostridium sp.]MCF0148161.1 flagellar FlbD family protein [Clostridium sp.]MDU5106594.1 flagellar FlbD family protein [Clostridium sp.]